MQTLIRVVWKWARVTPQKYISEYTNTQNHHSKKGTKERGIHSNRKKDGSISLHQTTVKLKSVLPVMEIQVITASSWHAPVTHFQTANMSMCSFT